MVSPPFDLLELWSLPPKNPTEHLADGSKQVREHQDDGYVDACHHQVPLCPDVLEIPSSNLSVGDGEYYGADCSKNQTCTYSSHFDILLFGFLFPHISQQFLRAHMRELIVKLQS
ncbi:MAG TPA: hypothetical protein VF817_01325 [Patescibacteria group bacterium]